MPSDEKLNIYQKLAKVRKMSGVIQKDRSGYNYKYTSIVEILAHVKTGMEKYGLSLIPTINPDAKVWAVDYLKTKSTKSGTVYDEKVHEYCAQGSMTYTWVNDDDPTETIVVPWVFSGSQSDPSQAIGSGLTYTERQFLTHYFQIATPEDDPDNFRSKQKEVEDMEDRAIAEEIVKKVHEHVTAYLSDNPDSRADMEALIKKYVKVNGKASANYMAVNDSQTAMELLNAIQNTFKMEE